MSDLHYRDALEAEGLGYEDSNPIARLNSNPPGKYTAIRIEQIGLIFLMDASGFPLPFGGS